MRRTGSTSRRYPAELRERAVRMVAEIRAEHESEWAAMGRVAELLGIGTPETDSTGHCTGSRVLSPSTSASATLMPTGRVCAGCRVDLRAAVRDGLQDRPCDLLRAPRPLTVHAAAAGRDVEVKDHRRARRQLRRVRRSEGLADAEP